MPLSTHRLVLEPEVHRVGIATVGGLEGRQRCKGRPRLRQPFIDVVQVAFRQTLHDQVCYDHGEAVEKNDVRLCGCQSRANGRTCRDRTI